MKREHSPQRAACAASRWRLRFLTDPLPTPEPSNRTAKINMPFAEFYRAHWCGFGRRAGDGAAAGCAGRWQARNRYFGLMKRGLETNAGHQTYSESVVRMRQNERFEHIEAFWQRRPTFLAALRIVAAACWNWITGLTQPPQQPVSKPT